jgi:hypothetical protein
MVAHRRDEHLSLVLQAAESLAVEDPVAVSLEVRTDQRRWFWSLAAFACEAVRSMRGERFLAMTKVLSYGCKA